MHLKGIPSTMFSKLKSMNIALEENRKSNGIWSKRLITSSCKFQTKNKWLDAFHT
jgi:hypothetical protein